MSDVPWTKIKCWIFFRTYRNEADFVNMEKREKNLRNNRPLRERRVRYRHFWCFHLIKTLERGSIMIWNLLRVTWVVTNWVDLESRSRENGPIFKKSLNKSHKRFIQNSFCSVQYVLLPFCMWIFMYVGWIIRSGWFYGKGLKMLAFFRRKPEIVLAASELSGELPQAPAIITPNNAQLYLEFIIRSKFVL